MVALKDFLGLGFWAAWFGVWIYYFFVGGGVGVGGGGSWELGLRPGGGVGAWWCLGVRVGF